MIERAIAQEFPSVSSGRVAETRQREAPGGMADVPFKARRSA